MPADLLFIARIPIDGTSWTPIILPVSCSAVWFRCDDSKIKIRTDAADATTEDTFNAGVQFVIPQIHNLRVIVNPKRFLVGDVICYVQSVGFMGGGEEDVILTAVLR